MQGTKRKKFVVITLHADDNKWTWDEGINSLEELMQNRWKQVECPKWDSFGVDCVDKRTVRIHAVVSAPIGTKRLVQQLKHAYNRDLRRVSIHHHQHQHSRNGGAGTNQVTKLELVDEANNHNKFWHIVRNGRKWWTKYGRYREKEPRDAHGAQSHVKTESTPEMAQKQVTKLVQQKLAKGYKPIDTDDA